MTTPDKRGQQKLVTAPSITKSDSQLNVNKDSTVQQDSSNVTSNQRPGCFRKLLMKISEKIGSTEKTEYKKYFQDMCKEMDEYRVIVEDIAQQLISTLQQDPRYVPKPPGKMEVEAPSQEDPFELLEIALKITNDQMESKKELEQIQTSAHKLASLRREYQRRGRRAIHGIRTFINVDYENIRDARNALEKFRQALDFARYELKSAKTPETIQVNNALYADALKNFQKQLYNTECLLKQLPEIREKHRLEIVKFFQLMRKYHNDCANATILSI